MAERCGGCGFEWDAIARDDVSPGITRAATEITSRLSGPATQVSARVTAERWSALEYAAHVRDVLLNVRDRIVQTLVEDEPQYAPIWREERVGLGLYAGDRPDEVALEVGAAGHLFARTFDRVDPALLGRTGTYAYPAPQPRTVLWIAAQALHECQHHLADIDEVLAAQG